MRTTLEALAAVNKLAKSSICMDIKDIKRAAAMRDELEQERRAVNRQLFDIMMEAPTPKSAQLVEKGNRYFQTISDISTLQSSAKERAALVDMVRGIFSHSLASVALDLPPTTGDAIDDILTVCALFDAAADMTITDILADINGDIFSEA